MGKRYEAKVRARLIDEVRASGNSVKAVAERMGVNESTAYFWMKRARAIKAPEFAIVVPTRGAKSAPVCIEIGRAVIRLERGFDAELLHEAVSVLSRQPS
jgi:transposase-like protein